MFLYVVCIYVWKQKKKKKLETDNIQYVWQQKKKKKKNGKLKKISFDVLMMFQLPRFATKLTSQFSTVFKTIRRKKERKKERQYLDI